MNWFPNRFQWLIIWLTTAIACHFWLELTLSQLWSGYPAYRWGLDAYLYNGYTLHPSRFACSILFIGALLVWQFSRPVRTKSLNSPPAK